MSTGVSKFFLWFFGIIEILALIGIICLIAFVGKYEYQDEYGIKIKFYLFWVSLVPIIALLLDLAYRFIDINILNKDPDPKKRKKYGDFFRINSSRIQGVTFWFSALLVVLIGLRGIKLFITKEDPTLLIMGIECEFVMLFMLGLVFIFERTKTEGPSQIATDVRITNEPLEVKLAEKHIIEFHP
jgi:hypothetical protein